VNEAYDDIEHAVSAAPSITMSTVFPDVMLDD
jgi:hypothetical protein